MIKRTLKNLATLVNLRPRALTGLPIAVVLFSLAASGCNEIQRPAVEPFYAVTSPPPKQELRWSNGQMPKSLDPALAVSAPETDVIRAVYEGLTDLDSKSLREIPAVAERWESGDDLRTWTFYLRTDARWSNGERVTANDFVSSWKRLSELREKTANSYLFQNIVGMASKKPPAGHEKPIDSLNQTKSDTESRGDVPNAERDILPKPSQPLTDRANNLQATPTPIVIPKNPNTDTPGFGVEAVDDLTLKVSLILPDKDFPKLVSNPIFRPVYGDGTNFEQTSLDPETVTNGAFRITRIADDGIILDQSDTYWNQKAVALERIRFLPAETAEAALDGYKKGDIDVVTNAAFEPLALKLLTPYEDFRRTTHSALNFYEFNTAEPPFDDRRVREALAVAIDREKLTEGDLEGSNEPAHSFFSLGVQKKEMLALNTVKAKDLLEKAGYADGTGFPMIRLVINRNDTQQRVARAVARMWKQNLNLDTDIIVKETSEIDEVKKSGDFDLLRRGIVLSTNDELVNITSVFGSAKKAGKNRSAKTKEGTAGDILPENQTPVLGTRDSAGVSREALEESQFENNEIVLVLTEADAIFELYAIPLYFPVSYSLVKPYVRGFEINGLDAPSLKEVSIDNTWRAKTSDDGL